jgi:glycine/D-amino acid oxidase-like deaminating enzyme
MSVAEVQNVRAELVSPARARELWPLLENNHNMLGALYHPDDGHIAPADVTMALAKGARDKGAKIYLNTHVNGFERLPSGEWKVKTNNGDASAITSFRRPAIMRARPAQCWGLIFRQSRSFINIGSPMPYRK